MGVAPLPIMEGNMMAKIDRKGRVTDATMTTPTPVQVVIEPPETTTDAPVVKAPAKAKTASKS